MPCCGGALKWEVPFALRAVTGLAGALLIERNDTSAAKWYWEARERAPRDLKQALGATMTDLQQVMRPQ